MKLSQHTDYALRILIYLAVREHEAGVKPVTVDQMAKVYGLSSHHLAKIAQALVQHGWVKSVRGRSGGLQLGCPPKEVVLGQVLRKMEKSMALVECMGEVSTCAIEPACQLKNVLFQARKAFLDVLDQHTLADVIKQPQKYVSLLIEKEQG